MTSIKKNANRNLNTFVKVIILLIVIGIVLCIPSLVEFIWELNNLYPNGLDLFPLP